MFIGTSVSRVENKLLFSADESETIDTRFGKITVKKDNPIVFSRGLLGIPNKFNFFLTEFVSDKLRKFKLLQSLDDYNLSFITLPLDLQNGILLDQDLISAANELNIAVENLAILVIVSVHRMPSKIILSVNARAPLLVDSASRLATQYVFQSDKYKVQHIITA
jgi:flagellar assembly factor FliW